MMSKTRNTQLLALVSALNLIVISIFTIIIGRLILVYLGSEYNGINSIVSQFLTFLSVLEGGFTTASLVALIKPYKDTDVDTVNQLFAETKRKFNRITIISLLLGSISAAVYGFAVKTNIPYLIVVSVLLIGVVNSTYNIGMISKYRLVFQAAQEEHIFSLITLMATIVGQVGMLIILIITRNIVFMRMVGLLTIFTSGALTKKVFLKRYTIVDLNIKWDGCRRIKGTKDVMVGKLVGTLHSSSTMLFLSIFSDAAIASVYAVYNSIIQLIVTISNMCFTAPQNAIGQVLQSSEIEQKKKIVIEYEYIAILILNILFVPLCILIVPFVKIYTHGVNDVQYVNYLLAILMVISTYIQLIHIPAGTCIYMSGNFKKAKNIQTIALIILIVGSISLGNILGMYGFVVSVLICNIFLSLSEIIYLHKVIIQNSLSDFIHMLLPNIATILVLVIIGNCASSLISGMLSWILCAVIISLLSLMITLLVNKMILKVLFDSVIARMTSVLVRKNK